MRKTPDLDRALSRLSLDRGGPRDLAAIRNGLTQAAAIAALCSDQDLPVFSRPPCKTWSDLMTCWLCLTKRSWPNPLCWPGMAVSSPPAYDAELDEARTLRDEGRSVIAGFQQKYAADTGITSLKIKHNNVLGYFIETTATHAQKMLNLPFSETYIHRQTTANQVRFTTVELSEIETRILNAGNLALRSKSGSMQRLSGEILARAARLNQAARGLAELDLTACSGRSGAW